PRGGRRARLDLQPHATRRLPEACLVHARVRAPARLGPADRTGSVHAFTRRRRQIIALAAERTETSTALAALRFRPGLEFTETFAQLTAFRLRHGLEFTEAFLHALLHFRVEAPELSEPFTNQFALLGAALAPLAHALFHDLARRRLTPARWSLPAMATGRWQRRLRHRNGRHQQRQHQCQ